MSRALNLIPSNAVGYGPSDGGSFPCLGVFSRRAGMLCPHSGDSKPFPLKAISLKCSSGKRSFLCKASSGGQRRERDPDFLRRNRQGFQRGRNRQQSEESDGSENFGEPDFSSLKNGPLSSLSNSNKNQATAAPGPREREIVELFRKVQAQLREKASVKEEKKVEIPREGGPSKEGDAVDSLLKLLRKHSVEIGKRKVDGGNESGIEFNLDQPRQKRTSGEDKSRHFLNSKSSFRDDPQEIDRPLRVRPTSSFRRKSPVPRVRYEPILPPKDVGDAVPHSNTDEWRRNTSTSSSSHLVSSTELEYQQEPEIELEPELESEIEDRTVMESGYIGQEVDDEMIEVDDSLDFEEEADSEEEEEEEEEEEGEEEKGGERDSKPRIEHKDLNSMKLPELRAMAKARGMKGYSKLKKSELVGLLSEDPL